MADMKELRTPEAVLSALEEGASKKLSREEQFEQRVSFVYGSMKTDSNITKDKIRKLLADSSA